MALFPAYAEEAKLIDENDSSKEKQEWLENSSYTVHKNAEVLEIVDSDKESVKPARKRKKKEKKQVKDKSAVEESKDQEYEGFEIDVKRINEYLSVNTISRPAVSRYRVSYYLSTRIKSKKRRFKRYYKLIFDEEKGDKEETPITKSNVDTAGFAEKDANFRGFKEEGELSKQTETFNKQLAERSEDVKLWLKYVDFQDVVYQFEKSYRKGSIVKAQRVLAERKIAILEKALTHNPNCEVLLRERLKVAVSAFPADELQLQLKKLVEKDLGNIILWQGYIESTQCSMSHCNTPSVVALYSKCLSTIHQLRRNATVDKEVLEESILRMLYQCGLFLKQAGLLEQLWTLLKMYLELNLSPTDKNKFNIEIKFEEKQLLELEEIVLNSQLPHHELWLRTEKLRESCHWLPVSGDEQCEDPQRLVFTEDVVELIQPITMPENVFKFVATILALLKVPLLPCRHCSMQDLGLDYVPWSLDSVESLLPVFVPLYPVDTVSPNLLKDTARLAVGPQYLKTIPGQDQYLNFVLTVMENCADCLNGRDQIAVRVWWFRFQRLLVILDKLGRFKMPPYLKKKIKAGIKNLLKTEEHRNNEVFYLEYALIEGEWDNPEGCKKILETALGMNACTKWVSKYWSESQACRCYLYKTLVEVTLKSRRDDGVARNEGLRRLVTMVLQRNVVAVNKGLLMEAETKFKSLSVELMDNFSGRRSLVEHFLPDFFTDWVICNGWFLFLSKGPLECGTFLEKTLEYLEKYSDESRWHREVLYEFYTAILFKHCLNNPGSGMFKILDDVLLRAIETFPNNLYLLAILAKEQSMVKSTGPDWWKIQNVLLQSGRAFATISAVLILELIKLELEKDMTDTITGSGFELTVSYKNRMANLFKKITRGDMCTRRCGLAWRLYLQFVHSLFSPTTCRNVYYSAVEECPWLKALYIDAAIYIPAELAQIQDLIIEKQLRLHVAPEELDILRS
ncbi:nuclear exosome regulator NRDE2 [Cylas formicarius]|uniref:nuclear exosome regulator NRDE2 n=1 Tax=Cylas formicarius TaxID=197179 RepID=UPI0029589F32|nr:nuclear exosome regulator NRDE2 [Cylas formicarius]